MCIVPGAYYFLLVFVCTIVQNTCCFCSATDLPFGSVCSTWLRFSSSHLQENNAKPKIRSNLNLRCKICHVYSCSMAGNPLLSVSYTDDFHLCSCSPFFFFPIYFYFLSVPFTHSHTSLPSLPTVLMALIRMRAPPTPLRPSTLSLMMNLRKKSSPLPSASAQLCTTSQVQKKKKKKGLTSL